LPAAEPAKSRRATSETLEASAAPQKVLPTSGKKSSTYSVQKGETLYAVARKHSIDVAQLAKMNNIPMTTQVQAGQKLLISEGPTPNKIAVVTNAKTSKVIPTKATPAKADNTKPKAVKKSSSKASASRSSKVSGVTR